MSDKSGHVSEELVESLRAAVVRLLTEALRMPDLLKDVVNIRDFDSFLHCLPKRSSQGNIELYTSVVYNSAEMSNEVGVIVSSSHDGKRPSLGVKFSGGYGCGSLERVGLVLYAEEGGKPVPCRVEAVYNSEAAAAAHAE